MPTPKKKVLNKQRKTSKVPSQRKNDLIEQVRALVDEYPTIYVFDLINSRTSLLKKVRVEFRDDGKFVFGKAKVMQIALGRTEEEAVRPNLNALGKKLSGSSTVGLFFTKETPSEIENRFKEISELDFARAGFEASRTVEIKSGPILGQPSSMLEPLRDLKLPVVLKKGVIELETDHVVCKAGDELTVEQAKILKFFGVMLSEFRIRLLWRWQEEGGQLDEL